MLRRLALLAAVSVLVPLAHARGASTANLLADPGAEEGLYAAWSTAGGFVYERYGAEFRPSASAGQAIGGGANVFAGGSDSPASSATQVVDVASRSATIDAGGETATLSASLGGVDNEDDSATVTATFLPGGASARIGPVTPADRGNRSVLLGRSTTAPVPAGTRSIRVVIAATRVDGIYTDGYADNLSLTLNGNAVATSTPTPAATATPGSTPTPSSSATPTPTPTGVPGRTRVRGKVKGIKTPGRRVKGSIGVAGKSCKTGRRILVKKGSKTVGAGRTKANGSFNIKTSKHKKGKLTVKVKSKSSVSTICSTLTKKVPGKN